MCAHGNGPRGHGERTDYFFSPRAAGRASIAMYDTDSGSHIAAREREKCFGLFLGTFWSASCSSGK